MVLLDVLVIGGGLAGVRIAERLFARDVSIQWKLLEARTKLGGRLVNDEITNVIDLGGAWIWPHSQPHMKGLVRELGLDTFLQPGDPSSTRVVGGAVAIVTELAKKIPSDRIHLSTPVISVKLANDRCFIEVKTKQETYLAKHVILAAPPKLLAKHIQFDPSLSSGKRRAMDTSQTWMAGVTKIALVFPQRFWLGSLDYVNTGLPPGSGPAFQMYEASTNDGKTAAITFFCLVPHNSPAAKDDSVLAEFVAEQVGSLWNMLGERDMAEQAHSFTTFHVYRWPLQGYISEDNQPKRINPHPSPVSVLAATDHDGRLHFAGSESDQLSPGVMEGAIGSAVRVLNELDPFLMSLERKKKEF